MSDVRAAKAVVVVHYPAGFGHRISVRGDGAGLTWTHGKDETWTAGDAWRLELAATAPVQFKPLLDDATWSLGPNYALRPGQTVDVWPRFFHDAGTVVRVPSFWSNTLQNARGLWIYLPPSYGENPAERYPVVYMHDGQNLFDDAASFSGVSWNVAGALDDGARDGSIHEAIVVGVENSVDRIAEYTPVADPQYGGGNAARYVSFLADELKPQIDKQYRTLPGRESTAVVGSSLGGLASVYAGISRPEVYGLAGALSPSTWWDSTWIIGAVTSDPNSLPLREYLDSGDSGPSSDDVQDTALLARAARARGIPVDYLVQAGGQHGETWWRQRIPGALAYLLGPR